MTLQGTAPDLTLESDVAKYSLGAVHTTVTGAKYRYMQANGAKIAATLYSMHSDTGTSSTSWQVEDIADAAVTPGDVESVPLCCPQIAMTDNYFAWVFVGPGSFNGIAGGDGVVVDTKLYVSATAGSIDDGATACLLEGVTCSAALSATTGKFHAHHELYAQDLPA